MESVKSAAAKMNGECATRNAGPADMHREDKFARFMARVDSYLEEQLGVTTSDLPDMDYWSMFDSGITARDTAAWVFVKNRS